MLPLLLFLPSFLPFFRLAKFSRFFFLLLILFHFLFTQFITYLIYLQNGLNYILYEAISERVDRFCTHHEWTGWRAVQSCQCPYNIVSLTESVLALRYTTWRSYITISLSDGKKGLNYLLFSYSDFWELTVSAVTTFAGYLLHWRTNRLESVTTLPTSIYHYVPFRMCTGS